MNGGTVAYIFGGGDGSTTQSADVSSAHIEINDGSVTSTIYGGGSLSSHVGTANIVINGGNHFDMCGGGGASGNESVGSADDAENSPCRVDDANITINGGDFRLVLAADKGIRLPARPVLLSTMAVRTM